MRTPKYSFYKVRRTNRRLYDKLWYSENKKLAYARLKRYRDKNKQIFIMYQSFMRLANLDKYAKYSRDYYKKNHLVMLMYYSIKGYMKRDNKT